MRVSTLCMVGMLCLSSAAIAGSSEAPAGAEPLVLTECFAPRDDFRSGRAAPVYAPVPSWDDDEDELSIPTPAKPRAKAPAPAPTRSRSFDEDDEDDDFFSTAGSSRRSAYVDEDDDEDGTSAGRSGRRAKPEMAYRAEPAEPAAAPVKRAPAEVAAAPVKRAPTPAAGDDHTTWISNDDAMSLASAQRVLWSLRRGASVKVAELRPHELLNYFAFRTAPVAPERTFSVLGDAVSGPKGEVSLAFAVQGAAGPRRPLDLTLVLDRSDSMQGEGRMSWLKRGLRLGGDQLVAGDRLDVVLFDDEVCTPIRNFTVGRDDPAAVDDVLRRLAPRGTTDLDRGLREGYRVATSRGASRDRNRRVLLVTDAELNTGTVNPDLVAEVGSAYEAAGVRLTAVGVGTTFRDGVLDKLTEKGKGNYVYLGSEAVVDRLFGAGFGSLTQTVAEDLRVGLQLPNGLSTGRFFGEESSHDAADVQPVHFAAGRTQVFLQDVRQRGPAPKDPIVLTLQFTDPSTGERREEAFRAPLAELLAADPANVRKARALMAMTDVFVARAEGDRCGAAWGTWRERAALVAEDPEIAELSALVDPVCVPDLVALKIKLDSDEAVRELALDCENGVDAVASLAPGDSVARFDVPAGTCAVSVRAKGRHFATVRVPDVSSDVRCRLRAGEFDCG